MENPNPQLTAAISAELQKHFAAVQDVHKKYEEDIKTFKGQVQEGTKDALQKLNDTGAKLIADSIEQKRATDQRILDLEQKVAAAKSGEGKTQVKTLGEQFVESEEFKGFTTIAKHGGRHVMGSAFRTKTITSFSNSAGPGAFPEFLPTPVIPNFQPLTIRDLLGIGQTNSNLINWVQELVFTNNAGYQGSEGNLKPQSNITYALQNVPVETIGHWIRASKQILSDFPMLQTLIDNRLTFGLKFAEEQEILYGSGASGHLHGLVPQATAYTGGSVTGDTKIDTIRKAMLQTTLAFYPATGIAMSPSDWADIQLTKDSQLRYIWANPMVIGPPMLWGLPVAECFSMQRGDFLVGALKLAATLFDRQEASILVSTEDQDNVVRNLVTILAEERIALAVSRPAAVIYGDFIAGETGK